MDGKYDLIVGRQNEHIMSHGDINSKGRRFSFERRCRCFTLLQNADIPLKLRAAEGVMILLTKVGCKLS